MRFHTLLFVAALGLLAACSSGEKKTDTPPPPAQTAHEPTQAQAAAVTLTGTLGCGHCNHHIGESCSAALETADGEVYILENLGEDSEPYQKRFDGGQIEVVGAVDQRDGVNYVQVQSYEL